MDQGRRGSAGFWVIWLVGVAALSALVWIGARFGAGYVGCRGEDTCVPQAARAAVFLAPRPSFLDLLRASPPEETGTPEVETTLELFKKKEKENELVKKLVKPAEQPLDEVPDWLKEGTGTKKKGEEGRMGSPDSKRSSGLYGLKGPKANKDPHLAKRLAQNAAKNAGVLGLLKQQDGKHIASIFGRQGVKTPAPKPLEVAPALRVGSPKVDGGLSAAVVKRAVEKYEGQVIKCYQRTFSNKEVKARTDTGWVTAAAVRRSTIKTYLHDAETCLNEKMRTWRVFKGQQVGSTLLATLGHARAAVADVPLALTWKLTRKKDAQGAHP